MIGQDELLEPSIIEGSFPPSLALLQPAVRLTPEQAFPIGVHHWLSRRAVAQNREDGVGLTRVDLKLDTTLSVQEHLASE